MLLYKFIGNILGVIFKLFIFDDIYKNIQKKWFIIKLIIYFILLNYQFLPIYILKYNYILYLLIFVASFWSSFYKTIIASLTFKLGNKEILSDLNGMTIIPTIIQVFSLILDYFKSSIIDLTLINYIILLIYIFIDSAIYYYFTSKYDNLINNTFKKLQKINKIQKIKIFFNLFIKYFDYNIGLIFNFLILTTMVPVMFSKLDFNIKENDKILFIQGIIFAIVNIIARKTFFYIKNINYKSVIFLNLSNLFIVVIVILNFNNDFFNYPTFNYIIFIIFVFLISFSSFILMIRINDFIKSNKMKLLNGELFTLIYYIGILSGNLYSNILI